MSDNEEDAGPEENVRREKIAQDIFGDSDSDEEAAYVPEDLQPKKKKQKTEKKKSKKDKQSAGRGSEDDAPAARTAEDDGFIDDRGAKAAQYEDDSEGSDPGEAMEDNTPEDELDAIFEKKKGGGRRRGKGIMNEPQLQAEVENFLNKMERAVDQDVQNNYAQKPAIHKLKMLPEVVTVLEKSTLHEMLLSHGLLNLLKLWLEPLPDGSLANMNLRSTLLRLMMNLPIDLELYERREALKKSGLGKVVMFLYKLPEETLTNKRMAQALVEKWSRPIFELSQSYADGRRPTEDVVRRDAEEQDEDEDADRQRKKKRASLGDVDVLEAADRDGPRPGEEGYRWHASVPQPVKMDYSVRPESRAKAEKVASRGPRDPVGQQREKLGKSILKLKMANKKKNIHAMHVSIEGRGVDRTL